MGVAVVVLAVDMFLLIVRLPQKFKSLPGATNLPLKKTAGLRAKRDIRKLPPRSHER